MTENNVWATQAEIISMAHLLRTNIYTYSKYGNQMKWLNHTAHFVDNSVQLNEKSIYLDHHTGDHFDVVITVGPEKAGNNVGEKSMLWSEVLKQANLTKQEYNRQYKQRQRNIPSKRDFEREKRRVKRSDPDNKRIEREKRRVKRSDPDNKRIENEKRRVKRSDPDIKRAENEKRHVKRSDPDIKRIENEKRRVKRSDPDNKRIEKEKRRVKRSDPDIKRIENEKRRVKRSDPDNKRIENEKRHVKRSDPDIKRIENEKRRVKRSDPDIKRIENEKRHVKRSDPDIKRAENEKRHVKPAKIPPLSAANGFTLPELPDHLSSVNPTETEERCCALRIPFMQLKQLGVGKQIGIYGNTVNVPMDPSQVVSSLPRRFTDTETIHLLFKRRTRYKSALYHETVRPKVIYDLTKYFIENSVLYQEEGVLLNEEWFQHEEKNEISFASEDDLKELQSRDKDANHGDQIDELEDTWNELSEEEQAGAGNKDTLFQNTDFTDDGVHALQIAPGENSHPISLFMDTYAEEKSFPVLFAGQKRCEDEDRLVPVKYSSICKAELRHVDGRFSKSVPNIFFKLKKLQALQVKYMATTALRKTKNVSFTAGELKSSVQIEHILKHDEGFRFLKNLRSSPSYYQTKQKELFAVINQLGLPTFFATFSAAETRWTDLLALLCKKNGKNFTEDDIADLSWMEKCDLIQKNPTTCARHFHYRTQLFLNNILRSSVSPIGKLEDYFIRVEFQQRGSPHLHCLFWAKDAPVYGIDSDEKVIKFIGMNITTSSDVEDKSMQYIQLQVHRHSKSCKKKGKEICRYGFPLPPMKETKILEPFDSTTNKDVLKTSKQNYEKVMKVMKTLAKDENLDFEQFLQKCDLTYEQYLDAVRSSLKKKQVLLKRQVKDVRVNGYNLQVSKIWQANTDLQYVLDPWAVCVYIASYIMKSQRGMSQLLQTATEEAKRGNLKLCEKVRLIANKFLNHCEVSAQEAIYLLLQLPLTQSSRDVIFINTSPPEKRVEILRPMSQIEHLPNNSTDVTCSGMIDKYQNRPKVLENVCLAEFASLFERKPPRKVESTKELEINIDEIDNNVENITPGMDIRLADGYRLVRRTTPKVIRYVKFNVRKDPELHYREQLMLFRPFRDELKLKERSSTYEQEYTKWREQILELRQKFQTATDAMEKAIKAIAEERLDEELDEVAPAARQSEDDARMDKEDQNSLLQPPNERMAVYDVALDIGGSVDKQEVTIPNID
ncbi:uncharacterized protein LOC123564956 [Mercenaria mercenaria]|uniref:uncharacterized protein LOC123564956 n=1 Tax=Mercenaria mercenaria TaxID=6596 RepID=UPI00234F1711|nr:uncharacterized protein LOC123564956 [Mercenaria mercenaria]